MQDLDCFEVVYVKSLMKSQSHKTRSGGGNMYDQSTRNYQHYTNIHLKQYTLDTLKNLKLHFKMLQDISLIFFKKKATKYVVIFSLQKIWNALNVVVCQIYL